MSFKLATSGFASYVNLLLEKETALQVPESHTSRLSQASSFLSSFQSRFGYFLSTLVMECCIAKKEITKDALVTWTLLQWYCKFCPYFHRETLIKKKKTFLSLQPIRGGLSFAGCVCRHCSSHEPNNFHSFHTSYRARPKLQSEFTDLLNVIPTAPISLVLLYQTIPSHFSFLSYQLDILSFDA